MFRRYGYGVLAVVMVVLLTGASFGTASESAMLETETIYRVVARKPRVNRLVTGPVTEYVQGVPAEPVHSFVWDGVGSEPTIGHVVLEINPVSNEGTIKANWRDEHGSWRFEQTAYGPFPGHPSGIRLGPSAESTTFVIDDPVPVNVYLHGDTTAGGPVLPTLFNHLATWGPAKVWLNGKLFENPYDGPTPLWVAHTMTSVGVRNSEGKVLTQDGEIYDPSQQSNGYVDYDDLEFHIVFHDVAGPGTTNNFPPPLSFFYHLTFEDVQLTIEHK